MGMQRNFQIFLSIKLLYPLIFEAFCFIMHYERERENRQKILVGKKRFYKNGWSVKTLFGQKYLSPSQNLVTFYRRVFVPVRLIRCGINKENGLPPIIEHLLYIFLIYLSLVNQKLKRVSSCLNKTIFKGSSG